MSEVKKRSLLIAGHPTSVTLEEPFWAALKELAAKEDIAVNALVERIDAERTGNLSSAIRVFVLEAFRTRA
ncbi:ribbon-helix-helix domain-containing protein [Niveispirillum irakense]|uniref:ribbon-helix-helix domain-containing protein n=1 Tax=Niveispirillum irakense TaxID=34011 RepID=UPI00041CCECB|nr:ribbon-helix-helix domain-containing protein [Niveispirillum irakense]